VRPCEPCSLLVHRELRGNQSMSPFLVSGCRHVIISYSATSSYANLASCSGALTPYALSVTNHINLAGLNGLDCIATPALDNFHL